MNLRERSHSASIPMDEFLGWRNNCAGINRLLQAIEAKDEMGTLESLSSLSMQLAAAQEHELRKLPTEGLTRILLRCAETTEIPDTVTLAFTCLSTLVDFNPKLGHKLVDSGALPVLTAKLANAVFIDVPETALRLLTKLSLLKNNKLLKSGVLGEVMRVFPFLESGCQLQVLEIAKHLVASMNSLALYKSAVVPYLGELMNTLKFQGDSWLHLNQKAVNFFLAMLKQLKLLKQGNIHEDVNYFGSLGLLKAAVALIEVAPTVWNLRLIRMLCRESADLCVVFCSGLGMSLVISQVEGLDTMRPEAFEALKVLMAVLPDSTTDQDKHSLIEEYPRILDELCTRLFPLTLRIYEKASDLRVRITLVKALHKVIDTANVEQLEAHLAKLELSSLFTELLSSEQLVLVELCLKTILVISTKLPSVVTAEFQREGVLWKVEELSKNEAFNKLLGYSTGNVLELLKNFDGANTRSVKSRFRSLCKSILALNQKTEQSQCAVELKKIVKALASSKSCSADWTQLIQLLETQQCSAYEINASGLVDAMWNWLSSNRNLRVARQKEFIEAFQPKYEPSHIPTLASKLVQCIHFLRVFEPLAKPKGSKKTTVTFVYQPSVDPPNPPLHFQFLETKKFTAKLNAYNTFGYVKASLAKLMSKEDFKHLNGVLKQEPLELPGIQLEKQLGLVIEGLAIPDALTVEELGLTRKAFGKKPVIIITFQQTSQVSALCADPEAAAGRLAEASRDVGIQQNESIYSLLRLLKLLHLLMPEDLVPISSKLTNELTASSVSFWISSVLLKCPFVFGFDARVEYFYSVLMRKHKDSMSAGLNKVQVSRDSVLSSAICIFSDLRAVKQTPFEVIYEGEIGTGLGPTLEFYELLGKEVRALGLWRDEQEYGLFPRANCKKGDLFEILGRIVGKALLERRQIDLPFSRVWWKLVLRQDITLYDLEVVDPVMGKHLLGLFNTRHESIPDLALYFEMPNGVELKPKGSQIPVTAKNLEEYVTLVAQHTLMQTSQAAAFRQGIEVLFPVECLEIFDIQELERFLCGEVVGVWSREVLERQFVPDHGYTSTSPTFVNLLEILSRFSSSEQKDFLRFVTGSARLPAGGLEKLRVTVVKREPSCKWYHPDSYLPSVMTCYNYLKLPDYSSLEVLQNRLKYAISEGQHSFQLS